MRRFKHLFLSIFIALTCISYTLASVGPLARFQIGYQGYVQENPALESHSAALFWAPEYKISSMFSLGIRVGGAPHKLKIDEETIATYQADAVFFVDLLEKFRFSAFAGVDRWDTVDHYSEIGLGIHLIPAFKNRLLGNIGFDDFFINVGNISSGNQSTQTFLLGLSFNLGNES